MKSSKSQILAKFHKIFVLRFEYKQLTSFGGLSVFQKLFNRVLEFDDQMRVISIEEKSKITKSKFGVPGRYFCDNDVLQIAAKLTPSQRGELEITAINQAYIDRRAIEVKLLGRGSHGSMQAPMNIYRMNIPFVTNRI